MAATLASKLTADDAISGLVEQEFKRRKTDQDGWQFDKKVPITMILTILILAASGMWGFADLKKDVELLKANAVVLHDRDLKTDKDIREALLQVHEQYRDLSMKLDRLIMAWQQKK